MVTDQILSFRIILETMMNRPTTAWLYLPRDEKWSLNSNSVILESDEVPPEMEDEPEAGVPLFAKQHNFVRVMPVASLQDVAINVQLQMPHATPEQLFEAFIFYYENDAYIKI
jgi:hypothetical protein